MGSPRVGSNPTGVERLAAIATPACQNATNEARSGTKTHPGRLELPTLRLTASRPNQLSYGSLRDGSSCARTSSHARTRRHAHALRARASLLEPKGLLKKNGIHIDASHSRQPLVKGERLVRYEVNAVMRPLGMPAPSGCLCLDRRVFYVAANTSHCPVQKNVCTSRFVRVILAQGPC